MVYAAALELAIPHVPPSPPHRGRGGPIMAAIAGPGGPFVAAMVGPGPSWIAITRPTVGGTSLRVTVDWWVRRQQFTHRPSSLSYVHDPLLKSIMKQQQQIHLPRKQLNFSTPFYFLSITRGMALTCACA